MYKEISKLVAAHKLTESSPVPICSDHEIEYLLVKLLTGELTFNNSLSVAEQFYDLLADSKEEFHKFLRSEMIQLSDKFKDDIKAKVATGIEFKVSGYRNPIYPINAIQICQSLISPITQHYRKQFNLNLQTYCDLFEHIIRTTSEMLESGLEYINDLQLNEGEFINELFSNPSFNEYANRYKLNTFVMSEILGHNCDDIRKVLSYLSLNMQDIDADLLFKNNPIKMRPFWMIDDDNYLLLSPTSVLTFFHEHISNLTKEDMDYFADKRGKIFEKNTFDLFKKKFKSVEVYREAKLPKTAPKDVIVKYGDTLLIIEVKSHATGEAVHNVNFSGIHNFLKKTIQRADSQTNEFKNAIFSSSLVQYGTTKDSKLKFIIDPKSINKVLRIAVIFNEIGGIHTNLSNLKPFIRLTGDDFSVYTYSDLCVIFDILKSEAEVLDYLIQRNKFQNKFHYDGDEMDLLCGYLKNRLDLPNDQWKDNSINRLIAQNINDISEFQYRKLWKLPTTKPAVEISDLWSRMTNDLLHYQKGNSRRVNYALYRVPYDSQRKIESSIQENINQIIFASKWDDYFDESFIDETSNCIFQIVLVKCNLARVVHLSKNLLEKYREMKHVDTIFQIYLNVHTSLSYAGFCEIRPKKTFL